MRKPIVLLILVLIGGLVACSSSPNTEFDPRRAVIKFFGAMEENDTTSLAYFLDFEMLMKSSGTDYTLSSSDAPRVFNSPQEILADLVDGGLTKMRWFSMQRVVGDATTEEGMAQVEVSFINKQTDKQYYTKFGLRFIKDQWKIYSFKVKDDN